LRGEELAEEQAALRRVATLVARGVPPEEVFGAVTEEAGRLLSVEYAGLGRYEPDGGVTYVAVWGGAGDELPVGHRWIPDEEGVGRIVFETRCPARIESLADISGQLGVSARKYAAGSGVGTPVIVEGRLWGVLATYSILGQPLPPNTEARLANFTELVATAIANAESRGELARLAEEQAALLRVATLVAAGTGPEELFAAVAVEVGQLLAVASAAMARYEPDGTVTSVAAWGTAMTGFPVGSRWIPEGKNLTTMVFETGRPARIDNYADASGPLGVARPRERIPLGGCNANHRRGSSVGRRGRRFLPGAAPAAGLNQIGVPRGELPSEPLTEREHPARPGNDHEVRMFLVQPLAAT
jgi:GAF domain-containing protein